MLLTPNTVVQFQISILMDNQGISPATQTTDSRCPGGRCRTAYPIGASAVDVSAISRALAQIDIADVAKMNREEDACNLVLPFAVNVAL
jgi:hypothetical protein